LVLAGLFIACNKAEKPGKKKEATKEKTEKTEEKRLKWRL
jgi:hypothetical protein